MASVHTYWNMTSIHPIIEFFEYLSSNMYFPYIVQEWKSFKALIRNIYSNVITPKKYWAILLSQYLTIPSP